MNYLILIAIGDYQHWRPLRGPGPDADALREVLFAQYGFAPERTVELRDTEATGENIVLAFQQWKNASADDQLLVYYAGHGHTTEFDRNGYWIPYDAGTDRLKRLGWVPNSSIRGALTALPFRHILLVCDSCFSGDLLDVQRDLGAERTPEYVQTAQRMRSREIITSGASEPVADANLGGHSEFAFHLIETLKTCPDAWIDPLRIYDHVRRGVHGQHPLFGSLNGAGHQLGGSFILQRQNAGLWAASPPCYGGSSYQGTSQPGARPSKSLLSRAVWKLGLIGLTMVCALAAAFQSKAILTKALPQFVTESISAIKQAVRDRSAALASAPSKEPWAPAAEKTAPPPAPAPTAAATIVAPPPKAPEPAPPPVNSNEITLTVQPAECQPRVTVGGGVEKEVPACQPEKFTLEAPKSLLTVSAKGYLTKTIMMDLSQTNRDFEVLLEPEMGELLVETDPEAKVRCRPGGKTEWMDCGLTDRQGKMQLSRWQAGFYDFELSKPSHESHCISNYALQPGKTAIIKWDLKPLPGQLRIYCVPDEADIWLDERKLSWRTPAVLNGIPAEVPHEIRVGKNGYRMSARSVTLQPGEQRVVDLGVLALAAGDLRIELANSELANWGELTITANGKGIQTVRGLAKGLESGEYVIAVEHADYDIWREKVVVSDGQSQQLNVKLKPKPGRFTLEVTRSGGARVMDYRLLEDGRELNKQDGIYRLEALRQHFLAVEAPGYVRQELAFTLNPNQTYKTNIQFFQAVPALKPGDAEKSKNRNTTVMQPVPRPPAAPPPSPVVTQTRPASSGPRSGSASPSRQAPGSRPQFLPVYPTQLQPGYPGQPVPGNPKQPPPSHPTRPPPSRPTPVYIIQPQSN